MPHLFTYGTLCVPEVMRAVIGRDLAGEPAILRDHRRRLVADCVFPAITACPGSEVTGTLFRHVDPATMDKFDAYEASFYERRAVTVQLDHTGVIERILAEVYLLSPTEAWRLSDELWEEAVFVREHLPTYLHW